MACSVCRQNVCNCATTYCCPEGACADPGLVNTGSHATVLDSKFCEFRLANEEGILFCARGASGQFTIYWTNEPCFTPPELTIGLGDTFGGIMTPMGDAGCWRFIKPGATGWLYSDGTNFMLAELPGESGIPDPLQINDLIVNETATIKNLVVGETLCFDALPDGTVVNNVGLNADGCLVKGEPPRGISMALYYESASETSAATPNFDKVDDDDAVIGHEIYDPDDIAGVLSETTIRIKTPGSYRIDWLGHFAAASAAAYNVALELKINGVVVSQACGRSQTVSGDGGTTPRSARVKGMHLVDLVEDDAITLKIGKSTGGIARLEDVKIILELFKPAA